MLSRFVGLVGLHNPPDSFPRCGAGGVKTEYHSHYRTPRDVLASENGEGMGSRPALASREGLALALDRGLNVYSIEGLDRALYAATDTIENAFERHFHPHAGTYYYDIPADDTSTSTPSWRLWLAPHDLITASAVTVGGVAVTGYQLRPDNRLNRPAEWIELDRAGSSSFNSGSAYSQRRAAIAGVWGWWDESKSCGALAAEVPQDQAYADLATAPAVGGAQVGVGHLIKVGSERMVVEDRYLTDTGENLSSNLAATVSAAIPTSITVADGTDYAAGEMLAIDHEMMLVQRVLSNTLFVRRGYAGTPVAAHTTGADIYAYRRLGVYRGAAGTTEADHLAGAAVTRWVPPYALEALCIAIAEEVAVQEGAAYARTAGEGESMRETRANGLEAAWRRARASYSRKGGRHYAV